MTLRIVFMGTPDFAAQPLAALLDAGHAVSCVYTQPPRPAGRGNKLRPSPVQSLAESRGIPVRHPVSLRDPAIQAEFAELGADIAVVAAYGLILPKPVLAAPRLGCVNIHASLLPRWRGAAPIHRAILAGDEQTGITIMRMEAGLDTGPILTQEAIPIGSDIDCGHLHDALAELGARMIVAALAEIEAGGLEAQLQPEAGVTYAAKLSRDEEQLDWRRPAIDLARQVRAFAPAPGAWFQWQEERVKVLAATPESGSGMPGMMLDDRLLVACGEGALRLSRLQRAGRSPLPAADFLRGFPIGKGARLAALEADPRI